jgi:hypothetical protein
MALRRLHDVRSVTFGGQEPGAKGVGARGDGRTPPAVIDSFHALRQTGWQNRAALRFLGISLT